MKNKAFIGIVSALVWLVALSFCAHGVGKAGNSVVNSPLPKATYLGGKQTTAEVTEALKEAGLLNTDVFQEWVLDFADTAGKSAELGDFWSSPEKLSADTAKCMEGWEKHHAYSDSNCRMTAFLLLDGLLSARQTEETYTGTYLMFDLEAMDTVEKYESLRKNRALFTTVFGDKDVPLGKAPHAVYTDAWNNYGLKVSSDKVSLLCVVIRDPVVETVFVGHTGLLVNRGDSLLFVEKIAFEQPYQATSVRTIDELLGLLSKRPEYFGEEGEPGPYVYVNGDYIGELIPM